MSSYFGPDDETDTVIPPPADEYCYDCNGTHMPHKAMLTWAAKKFGVGIAELLDEVDKDNFGRSVVMAMQLANDLGRWAEMAGIIAMKEGLWGEPLDEERFGPNPPEFPTLF